MEEKEQEQDGKEQEGQNEQSTPRGKSKMGKFMGEVKGVIKNSQIGQILIKSLIKYFIIFSGMVFILFLFIGIFIAVFTPWID